MIPMQITIYGNVAVKKNSMKEKWYYMKGNVKMPLPKPIKYYSETYNTWARSAMNQLVTWKSGNILQGVQFPINEPVMVWYIFFMKSYYKVDLSNLTAGIDDMLAGNIGLPMKTSNKLAYQVLEDDCGDIIKVSHQSYFVDHLNPRVDIFICDYDLAKYTAAFNFLYPGMAISTGLEKQKQVSFNFEEMFANNFPGIIGETK